MQHRAYLVQKKMRLNSEMMQMPNAQPTTSKQIMNLNF
jgi:hypothetical protein